MKNGVIALDEHGRVLDVFQSDTDHPSSDIEFHQGFICPGFINTHCHLELSHLKGKMKERTGIAAFIKQLLDVRSAYTQ